MKTRWLATIMLVVGLVVATTGVAYAITIVVDGIKESAWNGSGGQTPGSVTDANESAIADGRDIKEFKWTNDSTNMYFLMETYANTVWTGNPYPTLVICMDTDNNSGTGGTYTNCGMTGIERSIVCTRYGCELYDGDPDNGTLISNPAFGKATVYAEVGASISDLGLSGICDGRSMATAIYFDGGTTDPDDNTPDTGTFPLTCGTPTAVTLQSTQARPLWPAIGLISIGLLLTGVAAWLKRRTG